jgi:hypothetical protein
MRRKAPTATPMTTTEVVIHTARLRRDNAMGREGLL